MLCVVQFRMFFLQTKFWGGLHAIWWWWRAWVLLVPKGFLGEFLSEWFTVSCPIPSPTEQKYSSDLKANGLQSPWMETATFLAMWFWSIILPYISNIFEDASSRNHDLRSICWKLVPPDTLERWILLFLPWYPSWSWSGFLYVQKWKACHLLANYEPLVPYSDHWSSFLNCLIVCGYCYMWGGLGTSLTV